MIQTLAPRSNMSSLDPEIMALDVARREALDAVARATQRDRAVVLNEAIEAYLALQRWQTEHIEEGLRQAEAGAFASSEEVETVFARWC